MELITSLELAFASARAGGLKGIFGLLFFGLGFLNLYSIMYQFQIRGWPSTPGTLLKVGLRESTINAWVKAEYDYTVAVAYEYSVGGEVFVSKRFSPWVVVASYNLKLLLEKQIEDYRPGQPVPVYYNPRRPSKAFLKQPGIFGLSVTALFALFCFSTPVLIFGR
jgi:hypothetical protein